MYWAQSLPAVHNVLCSAGSACAEYTVVSEILKKSGFKPDFCHISKKQQCIGRNRYLLCQRIVISQVALRRIHCCFFRFDKNQVLNLIFVISQETIVYSAQSLPAVHNVLCSAGSDCAEYTVVSSDLKKSGFKPDFCHISRNNSVLGAIATCCAQRIVLSR